MSGGGRGCLRGSVSDYLDFVMEGEKKTLKLGVVQAFCFVVEVCGARLRAELTFCLMWKAPSIRCLGVRVSQVCRGSRVCVNPQE